MGKKKEEVVEEVSAEIMDIANDVPETEEETEARTKVVTEAKVQFNELVESYSELIFKFYHLNNKELKINLSLHLNGNSETIKVKTQMSFSTQKVTAEKEHEVYLQPGLPGVE